MRLRRCALGSTLVIGWFAALNAAQAQEPPAPVPAEPPVIPAVAADPTAAAAPAAPDPSAPAPTAPAPASPARPEVAPAAGVAADSAAVSVTEPPTAAPAAASAVADDKLGTIVVTAQRMETNLQSTPIAISAFGAEALKARAVTSFRDLAGQIPNLTIARTSISHTTQTYALRGIGESDPIQEPVVAVYVDDVYQPRQLGAMFDFNDIERVKSCAVRRVRSTAATPALGRSV